MTISRKMPRKLAPNHRTVFAALRKAGRPVTAYEIIDAVRSSGISAPPTVYRALNRLIDEGLAHRLESLNAFVACSHADGHAGAVIFMICNDCGASCEVIDAGVADRLYERCEEQDFRYERAAIELRGRCLDCSAAPEGASV